MPGKTRRRWPGAEKATTRHALRTKRRGAVSAFLCSLDLAVAQTICANGAHDSSPVHPVDPKYISRVPGKGSVKTVIAGVDETVRRGVIAGVDETVRRGFDQEKLFSELDVPWARTSPLYGPRLVGGQVGPVSFPDIWHGRPAVVAGEPQDRVDFTSVYDIVEGVCLAIENQAARNQVFNLGSGRSRAIEQFLHVLRRHVPHLSVRFLDRDELQPWKGTLSIDKARRLLGYSPRYSLEAGLEEYVGWHQSILGESRRALSVAG